jgi:hypothetical protein
MAKYVLLALPALLALSAVWCTQASLYTLPFRSRRIEFLSMLLLMWWDALRAAWMYWVGVLRVATVLAGWTLALASVVVKLAFAAARHLAVLSASATSRLAGECFRPGAPWLALMLLALWCAMEATVFTCTLLPTVAEVVTDYVGVDRLPRPAAPLLWCVLFLLIMGSFVCIQVLVEAIQRREVALIVLSVVVELFVMVLEVAFLYRELAEAIMPWLIQESGGNVRPGVWVTLSTARFAWMATRGMAWFLFGRYGTPLLLGVISRQPLAASDGRPATGEGEPAWWAALLDDLERHGWLRGKGDEVLEYLGAPALRLIAAALNFPMVLVTAQPLFSLPLQGLEPWRSGVLLPGDSRS